jgi:hypothetical protein
MEQGIAVRLRAFGVAKLGVGRTALTCLAGLLTTDQKVRGSSPFGRARENARDLRKRGSRAIQDLTTVDSRCS